MSLHKLLWFYPLTVCKIYIKVMRFVFCLTKIHNYICFSIKLEITTLFNGFI